MLASVMTKMFQVTINQNKSMHVIINRSLKAKLMPVQKTK